MWTRRPVALALSDALEASVATFVIGLAALEAPFKSGTLVPQPDVLVLGLPTDGTGAARLSAPWPAGLPPGFSTWYQFWIADPAGFAASNGVRGTTP
ncbi:MAG: hypothetical protein ACYTG2_02625 [Planctomycetota bacterium]